MALSEEEIAAGWIEWTGGQYPPVPQSQEVEYLDRGGFYAIDRVNHINWRHNTPCPSMEVVAYRLAERSAAKPEKERDVHFVAWMLYDKS